MSYYDKYIKYKEKYTILKATKQRGGESVKEVLKIYIINKKDILDTTPILKFLNSVSNENNNVKYIFDYIKRDFNNYYSELKTYYNSLPYEYKIDENNEFINLKAPPYNRD